MPELENSAALFYELNKNKYPFFEKILSCIHNINLLMVINNRHEDEILFPYILQIEKLYEKEEEYGQLFVRTLRKPLNILEKGNLAINELINEVETLTDNYTCSKKASLAMKVLYKQMKEMQDIFTQQKYLENAILFPKAMEIENIVLREKYNN